jgi:hypothetical protein
MKSSVTETLGGLWLLIATGSATAAVCGVLFRGDASGLPLVVRVGIAVSGCWAVQWGWKHLRPRSHFWRAGGLAGFFATLVALGVFLTICCTEGMRADRWQTLTDAARDGDAQTVSALLAGGIDPNDRPPTGPFSSVAVYESPLCLAAESGSLTTVNVLLEAGADINAGDDRNESPLAAAAGSERPEILKRLLDHGAEPNAANGDSPALVWAAHGDYAAMVELLLRHGANPNTRVGTSPGVRLPLIRTVSPDSASARLLRASGARP